MQSFNCFHGFNWLHTCNLCNGAIGTMAGLTPICATSVVGAIDWCHWCHCAKVGFCAIGAILLALYRPLLALSAKVQNAKVAIGTISAKVRLSAIGARRLFLALYRPLALSATSG